MADTVHKAIQKTIDETIAHPHFSAALPPLSETAWRKILVGPSSERLAENDRLEFLGDALMYATIGRQLYGQIPQGNPHLYTVLRSALHSNATFSRLAEKLDVFAVSGVVLNALTAKTFGEGSSAPSKERTQVKATADLFETVIGAYYLESGFERLNDWVSDVYKPLIVATRQTYNGLEIRRKKQSATVTMAVSVKKKVKQPTSSIRQLSARKDNIYSPKRPALSGGVALHSQAQPIPVAFMNVAPLKVPVPPNGRPLLVPRLSRPPSVQHIRPPITSAQFPVIQGTNHRVPSSDRSQMQPLPRSTRPTALLPTPRKRVSTPMRPSRLPIIIDLTLDDDSPAHGPKVVPASAIPNRQHKTPVRSPMTSDSDEVDELDEDELEEGELEDMLTSSDDMHEDSGLNIFT